MAPDLRIPAGAISFLTIACATFLLLGFRSALGRSTLPQPTQRRAVTFLACGIVLWFVVIAALALRGFFANFSALPPHLLLALFAPAIALGIAIFKSTTLREALVHAPVTWLIYLQTFRIFVELILAKGFETGHVPIQMTFHGRNFDILTGLSAPIAGWLYSRYRNNTFAIVWNVAGLALVLNVVAIAILSMPTPLRFFMNEPANTLLTYFPFIFLPAFLVPLAYTAHILSIRQLMLRK